MRGNAFKLGSLLGLIILPCVHFGQTHTKKPKETPGELQIAVVVSKQTPIHTLSLMEVRRIFLRETTQWPNGWAITVYERSGDHPIREQFSRIALGKDLSALRQHWLILKVTQGMRGPKPCGSTGLLKQYLGRVKGGIGYMYLSEADDTVKVVTVLRVRDQLGAEKERNAPPESPKAGSGGQ